MPTIPNTSTNKICECLCFPWVLLLTHQVQPTHHICFHFYSENRKSLSRPPNILEYENLVLFLIFRITMMSIKDSIKTECNFLPCSLSLALKCAIRKCLELSFICSICLTFFHVIYLNVFAHSLDFIMASYVRAINKIYGKVGRAFWEATGRSYSTM